MVWTFVYYVVCDEDNSRDVVRSDVSSTGGALYGSRYKTTRNVCVGRWHLTTAYPSKHSISNLTIISYNRRRRPTLNNTLERYYVIVFYRSSVHRRPDTFRVRIFQNNTFHFLFIYGFLFFTSNFTFLRSWYFRLNICELRYATRTIYRSIFSSAIVQTEHRNKE